MRLRDQERGTGRFVLSTSSGARPALLTLFRPLQCADRRFLTQPSRGHEHFFLQQSASKLVASRGLEPGFPSTCSRARLLRLIRWPPLEKKGI